jgi:hypothetical protein
VTYQNKKLSRPYKLTNKEKNKEDYIFILSEALPMVIEDKGLIIRAIKLIIALSLI